VQSSPLSSRFCASLRGSQLQAKAFHWMLHARYASAVWLNTEILICVRHAFDVYVFVCVANAYQWGFFTRCRDKVIAAFASALVMHYPAGAIVTVCAIVVTAYGGPATGEAWMQVGVWVSHMCYEWYSVYVHNHSQPATLFFVVALKSQSLSDCLVHFVK